MLDASPVLVRLSAGRLIAFQSLTFQPIMGRVMLLRTINSRSRRLLQAPRRRQRT